VSKHHHRPQSIPTHSPAVSEPQVKDAAPKDAEPRWTLTRMTVAGERPTIGGMQIGAERVVLG
jgi:hypothetical protein